VQLHVHISNISIELYFQLLDQASYLSQISECDFMLFQPSCKLSDTMLDIIGFSNAPIPVHKNPTTAYSRLFTKTCHVFGVTCISGL